MNQHLGKVIVWVYDWSGTGNNGTPTNSPVYSESGRFDKGMNFTAANSWVSVDNQVYFHELPMTISVWFKLDTLASTADQSIQLYNLNQPVGNPPVFALINKATDILSIGGRDSGDSYTSVALDSPFVVGRYYHVVARWNESGILQLYINGTQDSGTDVFDDIKNTTDPFAVGGSSGGAGNFLGVIDGIRHVEPVLDLRRNKSAI